jgi:hypothetical protein
MDPERVALVKDLPVTIQAEDMVNQMVQNMIDRMDLSGGQRLSTQQEAAVRQLMGSVKRGFARTMPEMFDAMIPVYADVYTEQELRDVIAFFKTPSGQAYVAKSVQASAAAMEAVSSVIPICSLYGRGLLFPRRMRRRRTADVRQNVRRSTAIFGAKPLKRLNEILPLEAGASRVIRNLQIAYNPLALILKRLVLPRPWPT